MPFKSKKKQFRGTPAWKLRAKEETNAESLEEASSSSTSTAHVQSLNTRLSTNIGQAQELNCNAITEGYRLIDLTCLNDALSNAHQCVGARLSVVDTGVRHGLCSKLSFMCLKCGIKTNWDTSQHINRDHSQASPSKLPFDVNRRATYGVSEVGLGREGLATFCGIMGMPLPSNPSAWQAQIKTLNDVANSEFEKERNQAAIRLRNHLKNEIGN